MNKQNPNVNRQMSKGRISSLSIEENNSNSSTMNSSSSFQSFVDDIPYEFNQKYRIIHLSNIEVDEYDTKPMVDLLSRTFDFQLENQVLLEALEDVKRKKKEIETDGTTNQSLNKTQSNIQTSNECTSLSKSIQYDNSINASPSISTPTISLTTTSNNQRMFHPTINHLSNGIRNQSPSNSYRLPSVRDIYWPNINQQQYSLPPTTNPISSPTVNIVYPINPTSQIVVHPSATATTTTTTTTFNPSLSISSSVHCPPATTLTPINSTKSSNRSTNNSNSFSNDDLTSTFDGTLTVDDPFHDAELRSLNDVAELNHLYSSFGSANTIRR